MWREYYNGNMTVKINDKTGTRICETTNKEDNEFYPEFPLNLDIHISSKCSYGCPMCYAGCTPNGKHADFFAYEFINTLHPHTELALNLNSDVPPQFEEFLRFLKKKDIITNVTVNQRFLETNSEYIDKLYEEKLIYGLGVSLTKPTPEFIDLVKRYPNAVIHTINGILRPRDIMAMADKGLKILILGYKMKNRGGEFYEKENEIIKSRQKFLYDHVEEIKEREMFDVLSFDCLAIDQLQPQRFLSKAEFERIYQGDDGTMTFAIDMVKGTFSKSSTDEREYPVMDSVEEMFKFVREMA